MNGFLLDENLPGGLSFQPSLPVSHALDLGANPTDSELWSFAKERRLVIVTKDADFSDRILVSTPPPWIGHLRFGNMRRKEFHRFLAAVWPQVESLLPKNRLVSCMWIGSKRSGEVTVGMENHELWCMPTTPELHSFLSFSGPVSKAVGAALFEWLKALSPSFAPFMSDRDISAGSWSPQ